MNGFIRKIFFIHRRWRENIVRVAISKCKCFFFLCWFSREWNIFWINLFFERFSTSSIAKCFSVSLKNIFMISICHLLQIWNSLKIEFIELFIMFNFTLKSFIRCCMKNKKMFRLVRSSILVVVLGWKIFKFKFTQKRKEISCSGSFYSNCSSSCWVTSCHNSASICLSTLFFDW